ncbi:hypothetical protein JCM10908_001450 [Rhodotorula pacifica]|uniref:Erd1p n=1 Tax=Rhodotorula pacifica TaxID=1495444 RepID=UPI00316B417A
MDIDTPPPGGLDAVAAELSEFGLRYPLPFRILLLSAVTVLGFATNTHILATLGIDTALVLDVRLDQPHQPPALAGAPASTSIPAPFVHPSRIYPPLYSLAAVALAWTTGGWLLFRTVAGGEANAAIQWRVLPAAFLVGAGIALCWPGKLLYQRERFRFLRSLRRIVSPSLNAAVPFCDIILADILTSSAKVLGDIWIAGCLVVEGRGVQLMADECKRVWGVPFMTSLPYIFRFRQCLSEVYTGSTPTPRRSLLNALKYATAFPVIILSAMQTVIGDPFDPDETVHEAGEQWIGRTTLFNLWILAVLINSLYSFWWDVTNDWGLSLLTPSGWSSSPAVSYAFIHPPAAHGPHAHHHGGGAARHSIPSRNGPNGQQQHHRVRSLASQANGGSAGPTSANGMLTPPLLEDPSNPAHLSTQYPPPPSRPHSPMPKPTPAARLLSVASTHGSTGTTPQRGHTRAFSTATSPNLSYPFLRPILLLPDPSIYYLCILLDLILRLTWSLKLSSHLHSAQEVEAGVFVVELMEVVRRWMWVYLRIEWEAVRKGAGSEVVVGGGGLGDGTAYLNSGSSSPSLGPSSGGGVSWLEKGDGEARLRAQEEYELAAIAAAGRTGGTSGGSSLLGGDVKVAPIIDIPSRV